MNVVHIITKSGMERLTTLGSCPDLQSWWVNTRMSGAIVGNTWACPFDEVAFAEIVEANIESVEEPAVDPRNQAMQAINKFALGGLAAAIADGSFRPPSE